MLQINMVQLNRWKFESSSSIPNDFNAGYWQPDCNFVIAKFICAANSFQILLEIKNKYFILNL